jgi:hypothetical protein
MAIRSATVRISAAGTSVNTSPAKCSSGGVTPAIHPTASATPLSASVSRTSSRTCHAVATPRIAMKKETAAYPPAA